MLRALDHYLPAVGINLRVQSVQVFNAVAVFLDGGDTVPVFVGAICRFGSAGNGDDGVEIGGALATFVQDKCALLDGRRGASFHDD